MVDDVSDSTGVHPHAVLATLVLGALLFLMQMLASKPRVAKFEPVRDYQLHQQRIDKIRNASKTFSPPYPNGTAGTMYVGRTMSVPAM